MNFNKLYLLLAVLFLMACEKNETKDSPITADTTFQALVVGGDDEKEGKDKDGKGKEYCFDLIYPMSITMPDASILSGEEDELWEAVKDWYEANPDSDEKPNINYPIEVLWKSGEQKTVEDEADLVLLKDYCDKKKEKDCFDWLYPITWTLPDGTTLAMEDKDGWEALKEWYENHPDAEAKPALNYPIEVLWYSGEVKSVEDETDLELLKKYCDKGEFEKNCFDWDYPISWTMPDGTILTMEDKDDWEALKAWYENHPDVEAKPTLNYPLTIVFNDGTTQGIADEAEMESAKEDCE